MEWGVEVGYRSYMHLKMRLEKYLFYHCQIFLGYATSLLKSLV